VLSGCGDNTQSDAPRSAPNDEQQLSPAGNAQPEDAPAVSLPLDQTVEALVQRLQPSVVQITGGGGVDSGVIIDARGFIVTNARAASAGTKFQVRLAGKSTTLPATLIGSYPPDDIAVIKLDSAPSDLPSARFGDSSKLTKGQLVLAMGPLDSGGSVTNGMVSAVGQTVAEAASINPAATVPDAIQISAPINPGNAGGALVDLSGNVVGIPIVTGPNSPGIEYAIASNLVVEISNQIIKTGHVTDSHRSTLGVGVTNATVNGQSVGVSVVNLDALGPAATAGIKPGEVINAINNAPIPNTASLLSVLAHLEPGKTVPVTVANEQGVRRTITVRLVQLPAS
jgi:S1-C subfamily serine protease